MVLLRCGFEAYNRKKKITSSFVETEKTLNTHDKGQPTKTLDALYADCAQTYLNQDINYYVLSLEFFAQQLLKSCTYRVKNCADDYAQGLDKITLTWDSFYDE